MVNQKIKDKIDAMSYEQLLYLWRFGPIGDPMFIGEEGAYLSDRMEKLRALPGGDAEHVRASKSIGWG